MSSGLFALLDDIVAIAKVAAASLDDAAAQALAAGKKTAGIVIDDAAVTPRYVVGALAERELPIVMRIAVGSLKNKMFYLLPAALALTLLAPWAITPLLMAGGAFLCFEGWEKVHQLLHPPAPDEPVAVAAVVQPEDRAAEDQKVASAIRTDMILSAEIMAITLATITADSFWVRAFVLGLVGTLVTIGVYGAVALIVKADDFGVFLAERGRLAATRAFGRGIVRSMPPLLKGLSIIGMLAMLWVGGGIILHGLEEFGWGAPAHAIHGVASTIGSAAGPLAGAVTWLVDATGAALVGLAIGWLAAKAMALAGH
jgi:predicted DNA repair protein MutK